MQGVPGAGADTGPVEVRPVHTGKVVSLALVAALGGFLFGYDSSVINGANQAVFKEFNITDGFFQGFVVSIALLGSAIGAFFGGRFADKYGRRKVMLAAAIMFLVAGVGQGLPFATADFMFWRVLGGFAIGLAAVISPMYISEIAPAHLRGRLSSLFQLAIVLGIFSTQLVNQVLLVVSETDGAQSAQNSLWGLQAWNWMFLCMVIPAVIYFALAIRLPESPRFLVAQDEDAEAKKVLSTIYQGDVDGDVSEIRASLAGDHKPSLRDIRGLALGIKPIVWVGIILAIFQQFVGINAVFYYSNTIWAAVGFPESRAFLTSTIISAVNVVFTLVAISLVDRIGRKPLLLIGSAGMAVMLGVLAFVFASAPTVDGRPELDSGSGTIAVVALNVYVAFFAATWGPVVWVLLGEMFPNRIRAAAMSVAVMSNWLANFVVSTIFPELVEVGLGIAYGLFTLFAVLSIFYVAKYVKETKGVALEQMSALEGVR
jgi:MFS transporter, SP family, sugar:H+ symporter